MSAKKSQPKKTNPESPNNPIHVIKEAKCKSLEGSATLHYLVGTNEAGEIQFKIDKNSGGGFFSNEWVAFAAIQKAFTNWPADTPINSMALRPLFKGKSVNTPSFMLAVLTAEGLLEPMPKRKRVHRACDPAEFLASLDTPHQGGRVAKPKKPAAKSKAKSKVKAKAQSKPKPKSAAKVKSPRKTAVKARKKS